MRIQTKVFHNVDEVMPSQLVQVCAFGDLMPKFGSKADLQLTNQTSLAYSSAFWLNKYFNKTTYFALTPLLICIHLIIIKSRTTQSNFEGFGQSGHFTSHHTL